MRAPPLKLLHCLQCQSQDTRLAYDKQGQLWLGCAVCRHAGPLKLKNGAWLTVETVGIELAGGDESAGGVPQPSIN